MFAYKHLGQLALAATFVLAAPLAAFAQNPADETACASAKTLAASTAPSSVFVRTGTSGKWTKLQPSQYQSTFQSAMSTQQPGQIGRVWKQSGHVGWAQIDTFSGNATPPTMQAYCYRHGGSLAMVMVGKYNPGTKTFTTMQVVKMNPGGTALANASPAPEGVKLYPNPNSLPFSTQITGP